MPRKRRYSKRNLSPEAELEIWGPVFECGHAFSGDLADVGLIDPDSLEAYPQREAITAAFMRAAHEAWDRLGAIFLERTTWAENDLWVLAQFGQPGGKRAA